MPRFVTNAPAPRKPVLRARYKMTAKNPSSAKNREIPANFHKTAGKSRFVATGTQNRKPRKPCGFLVMATLMMKAKTTSARKKAVTLAP